MRKSKVKEPKKQGTHCGRKQLSSCKSRREKRKRGKSVMVNRNREKGTCSATKQRFNEVTGASALAQGTGNEEIFHGQRGGEIVMKSGRV